MRVYYMCKDLEGGDHMDRDEKYMAMFDEWLRAQKEKEAAASAAPEGAGPAGQQAYTQPWAPAESAHMQQPG